MTPRPGAPRDGGTAGRLRILTWHVHGNYLHYLSHAPHDFFLMTLPGHPPGHAGRVGALPWRDNVHEVPAAELADHRFDAVLYQSRSHWDRDRHERLTAAQRALPAIYLEHDPPQEHPTSTRHPAAGSGAHIVQVTAFNALMWDAGGTPTTVIEHGVSLPDPGLRWTGERPEGIVVINNLARRGRRLGADLYLECAKQVPLVLTGMDSESLGGIGETPNPALPALMAQHRFFFHPVRYTSLGLALIEAMMIGLPIVGLATTELPTVIQDGVSGCIDTRPARLVEAMRALINDPPLARRWGTAARETALARFGIDRFATDWDRLLRQVVGSPPAAAGAR
jgi:glycosyltransferase involved in cell wall biosynthesis